MKRKGLARGQAREGLATIEEASAFAEETGERYLEAELHRLRGELLLLETRLEAATDAVERAPPHDIRARARWSYAPRRARPVS